MKKDVDKFKGGGVEEVKIKDQVMRWRTQQDENREEGGRVTDPDLDLLKNDSSLNLLICFLDIANIRFIF